MEWCQKFQAAGDRLLKLEVQMARAEIPGGQGQMALHSARRELCNRAIAGQVARRPANVI